MRFPFPPLSFPLNFQKLKIINQLVPERVRWLQLLIGWIFGLIWSPANPFPKLSKNLMETIGCPLHEKPTLCPNGLDPAGITCVIWIQLIRNSSLTPRKKATGEALTFILVVLSMPCFTCYTPGFGTVFYMTKGF